MDSESLLEMDENEELLPELSFPLKRTEDGICGVLADFFSVRDIGLS